MEPMALHLVCAWVACVSQGTAVDTKVEIYESQHSLWTKLVLNSQAWRNGTVPCWLNICIMIHGLNGIT